MTDRLPETRYARSGGVNIAYQVVGEGPVDLVYVPGFLSHAEWSWEHPPFARFLRRLSSFSRLILLDKRGTGMSDPVSGEPGLADRVDDIRAVMDAAGSERAVLLGIFEGAALGLEFAATRPERVEGLVLYASLAKFTQGDDYPWGWSPAAIQLYLAASEEGWGSGDGADLLSATSDDRYRAWFARLLRLSASPGMATTLMRMNTELDVRDALPAIAAPTLVLHRTDDPLVSVEHGRYVAERVPGARLVEFPGSDHWPWAGNADPILGEIEEFLTGTRAAPEHERVLATLLFTDIVKSTERARELGDRRWRDLLEDQQALVRREIERFRGREIQTVGDGFFATFDGPTRAIRCAAACRSAVRELSLELRAGVHTGECELIGDGLGGIAVHIAARVASAAGAGEVFVSGVVRDLVEGSSIRFEDRGGFSLKGLDGERRLFAADVER